MQSRSFGPTSPKAIFDLLPMMEPTSSSSSLPLSRRELFLSALTVTSLLFAAATLHTTPAAPPRLVGEPAPLPAGTTFTQAGRTVVITGSSKGIGKGMALVFAEAGANVLVNSRHLDEAEAVAQEIIASGGVASAFAGDVSVEADVQAMMAAAVERYGGIDVVCANAGVIPDKTLDLVTVNDWDSAFATNVRGTFLTVKYATPHLKRSAYGRVVLTSSITGPITGFPGWAHYGATKAAQLGFMRSAAMELAAFGITINAIQPGNIITEGLAALGEEFLAAVEAVIPLGRLGSVRDTGYAALYFASKEAKYVTGTTIVVDGGQIIPEQPSFRDKW